MIPRSLVTQMKQIASWFPVVSVTGPRQSGKSTLIRSAFNDYEYVNLENPGTRQLAENDPVGFINTRPGKLIIDEAQYIPELFSMVQVASDERGTTGQYVLSGSQNFLMLKNITQSLAGRVGLLRLLPLSFSEAQQTDIAPNVDEFMFVGGYPRPYDVGMLNAMRPGVAGTAGNGGGIGTDAAQTADPTIAVGRALSIYFNSYVRTYIERDVQGYLDVRDASAFLNLLQLCAQNSGNLVNYTAMADSLSISFRTVKSWLSILESSYITFELPPYHKNLGKRITKTPKLYFYDTGLLCYLLGIHSLSALLRHPMLGAVFENLIVAETAKNHYNLGEQPELYFYRDSSQREVDLLDFTDQANPSMAEIKSSQTYHGKYGKTLVDIGDTLGVPSERRSVIYRGEPGYGKQFRVVPASDYLRFEQ